MPALPWNRSGTVTCGGSRSPAPHHGHVDRTRLDESAPSARRRRRSGGGGRARLGRGASARATAPAGGAVASGDDRVGERTERPPQQAAAAEVAGPDRAAAGDERRLRPGRRRAPRRPPRDGRAGASSARTAPAAGSGPARAPRPAAQRAQVRESPAGVDRHGPQAGRHGQVGGRGRVALQAAGQLEVRHRVELAPPPAGDGCAAATRASSVVRTTTRRVPRPARRRADRGGSAPGRSAEQRLQDPRRQVAGDEVDDVEIVDEGMPHRGRLGPSSTATPGAVTSVKLPVGSSASAGRSTSPRTARRRARRFSARPTAPAATAPTTTAPRASGD